MPSSVVGVELEAASISIYFGLLRDPVKKGWSCEGGLGLAFQGSLLSSHAFDTCTSIELAPSHVTHFQHPLKPVLGIVRVILTSAIPSFVGVARYPLAEHLLEPS